MRRLLIAVVLLAACRAKTPEVLPQTLADPNPQGDVSAKLIPDPSGPTLELGADEEFVRPYIRPDNPQPAYPEGLVRLRLAPHVIAVRMIVDERGQVAEIGPSPVAESTTDEYCAAFEESVKTALRQWRVSPPQIRKFRPGADLDGDGKADYRVLASSRALKAFFDISFTFAIVDGKPVVRRSSGK